MKIELEVNSNSIFVYVFLIPLELKRLCHKKISSRIFLWLVLCSRKVDFCFRSFGTAPGTVRYSTRLFFSDFSLASSMLAKSRFLFWGISIVFMV